MIVKTGRIDKTSIFTEVLNRGHAIVKSRMWNHFDLR